MHEQRSCDALAAAVAFSSNTRTVRAASSAVKQVVQ